MKLKLRKANKEKDKTFSERGILSFVSAINDWLSKAIAVIIKDGFDRKCPTNELEVELTIKADGIELSDKQLDEICENNPKIIGLNYKALLELLRQKAGR